ncbi:MAG TPA: hypothetical protein VJJ22_03310 [Candidatus Paceibacterota bacterium]
MKPGNIVKVILLTTLFLGTIIFGYSKSHELLFGSRIFLIEPENGVTISEPFIVIRGIATGSTLLTIDGAKILTDGTGNFEREMLLGIGYNVIEIQSLDRFNRKDKKTLELVYKPKDKGVEVAASIIN